MTMLASCSKVDLSDSIYVPDKENHELPAYTEWGYNTFGVIYERDYFTYDDYTMPLKVTLNDNKISFLLQGSTSYSSSKIIDALRITIPENNIAEYQDLLIFNDSVINLTDESVCVEMFSGSIIDTLKVSNGSFHIKRTQRLFVDDVEQEVIMSGVFNLDFIANTIPSSFSIFRLAKSESKIQTPIIIPIILTIIMSLSNSCATDKP